MTSNFLNAAVRPVAGWAVLLAFSSLTFAQSVVLNSIPTRVFGHTKVNQLSGAPNLVEGRELSGPQGVAVDTSVSPPILYIADTFNNRVLAFKNASALTKGNTADKVIGQRDLQTTVAQGPGTALSTGLTQPTGIAVDKAGNLYVIDAGNQRILRFPKPFSQTGDLLTVDLVIGQKTTSSGRSGNQNGLPSAKTVFFTTPADGLTSGLAFDPQGNLWVTDTNNNRVLRYPVSQLSPNTSEPTADTVIGQTDFTSRAQPTPPQNVSTALYKGSTVFPSGISFDSQGRMYVADALRRVLYYSGGLATGSFASRILGIQVTVSGQTPPTLPNNIALGDQGFIQGILVINDTLFVADAAANRIVRYNKPESWPAETLEQPSPPMASVLGQASFNINKPNRGEPDASPIGFWVPIAMAYSGTELWVVEAGNNRAVSFSSAGDLAFGSANRVVGQVDFLYSGVNLVEGREIFVYNGSISGLPVGGSGVVIDRNSNPPRLYIADSLNNRVLGFADARKVKPGDKADLVIGQTDFFRTLVNSPRADQNLPTDSGLSQPTGLALDDKGNLWVADRLNGRLLRFPSPFTQPSLVNQKATLVLGQSNFFTQTLDASSSNMRQPYGIAILSDGSVVASDVAHHRVLLFKRPAGGDFTSGQAAALVYGQSDFFSSGASGSNTSINRFNRPTHIAADTDDRLFVADNGTGRVLVFARPTTSLPNSSIQITGFNGIAGLTVSTLTGELWVADTNNNRVVRYPQYDTLAFNPQNSTFTVSIGAPLAVGLDAFDNLLVVDGSNEVAFYYQAITFQNAATYATRALAPGMLAYLYRAVGGRPFDSTWNARQSGNWTTDIGDVQVLVNGTPAPVYEILSGRVDFMVPMNAPTSDTAEFTVIQKSTGLILGVSNLPMAEADPGLYTQGALGFGQLAATHPDGSVNGPANGAPRGSIVTLYGTGQGFVPNAPPDGQPGGAVSTPVKPRVFIAGVELKPEDIQYSGLTSFPAGWQLNVKVPDPQAAPGMANQVNVFMRDIPGNRGPFGQITTTIWVK